MSAAAPAPGGGKTALARAGRGRNPKTAAEWFRAADR